MKLVVITQEDRFVIPQNIERILNMEGIEVLLIATIDGQGSLENRKGFFLRGFGFWQSWLMGYRWLAARLGNGVDRLFGYRLLPQKYSIRAVAKKYRIPFANIGNPNQPAFLARLKELGPDLVVSMAAPCIFRPELLSLPARGCINLHCSPLPRYAGVFPSFWVLFNGESETGATVHYMDSKIDNGPILGQVKVPIDKGMSVFALIQRTKAAGGDLLVDVIRQLQNNRETLQPNLAEEGSYFPWPTVEQMKEFRRQGGRFV
jgi:methionyl-tRNA formyltransferase